MFPTIADRDPDGHYPIPLPPQREVDKERFETVEVGVRQLVKTLWDLGYKTTCSCEGHETNLEPYPWIVIRIKACKLSKGLEKLALAVAHFNLSQGVQGRLPEARKTWTLSPQFVEGEMHIYLQPLDINPTRSFDRISELRQTANELALYFEKYRERFFS